MTDKTTIYTVKPLDHAYGMGTHVVYSGAEIGLPKAVAICFSESDAETVRAALSAAGDLERATVYFQALNPLNMWSGVEIATALREKWWER